MDSRSRAIGLGVVEGVGIWNSSWLTNKDLVLRGQRIVLWPGCILPIAST